MDAADQGGAAIDDHPYAANEQPAPPAAIQAPPAAPAPPLEIIQHAMANAAREQAAREREMMRAFAFPINGRLFMEMERMFLPQQPQQPGEEERGGGLGLDHRQADASNEQPAAPPAPPAPPPPGQFDHAIGRDNRERAAIELMMGAFPMNMGMQHFAQGLNRLADRLEERFLGAGVAVDHDARQDNDDAAVDQAEPVPAAPLIPPPLPQLNNAAGGIQGEALGGAADAQDPQANPARNPAAAVPRDDPDLLDRLEPWHMNPLPEEEGIPMPRLNEWWLEMHRREQALNERLREANAAEDAARHAVQAAQAERERIRADDQLLEMQIRLAQEQQNRARAEALREAAEAQLIQIRLGRQQRQVERNIRMQLVPPEDAMELGVPPPAVPGGYREAQERLAARRAHRRQLFLDGVGRERGAAELGRPVVRPVARPAAAAAEAPRLPALQWELRERHALRMLHRQGADQAERDAYVQELREQRRQYEEHRLRGGPPPPGMFPAMMPPFHRRERAAAPRAAPAADNGALVIELGEEQQEQIIDEAEAPEAPQPAAPPPIAAVLRQLVEAVDGVGAAVAGGRQDNEQAIDDRVAAMEARFPALDDPEFEQVIAAGLQHLAGYARGVDAVPAAAAAAVAAPDAEVRPPRLAEGPGANPPPRGLPGLVREMPIAPPRPMDQLGPQHQVNAAAGAGMEERMRGLQEQARRQLNILRDQMARLPRRPQFPAFDGGNVPVFGLGAAMQQVEDREERQERERLAAEAQRAAWNEEREANDLPETLALRYSRACCVCHKENPRRRAVMVACGHCCVCMPCAEEMAGGRRNGRIDCLICRARTGFVRLYEDLEHEMAPRAEGGEPPAECQSGDAPLDAKRKEGDDDEQGPSSAKQPRTVQ